MIRSPGGLGQQRLVQSLHRGRPATSGQLHQRRRMWHRPVQGNPAEPPAEAKLCAPAGSGLTPPWSRRTCAIRPIPGCWARRYGGSPRRVSGFGLPAARCVPGCGTGRARRASARTRSRRNCGPAASWAATRSKTVCSGSPGSWPIWPRRPCGTRNVCWSMRSGRCGKHGSKQPSWPRQGCTMRPRGAGAVGWPCRQ